VRGGVRPVRTTSAGLEFGDEGGHSVFVGYSKPGGCLRTDGREFVFTGCSRPGRPSPALNSSMHTGSVLELCCHGDAECSARDVPATRGVGTSRRSDLVNTGVEPELVDGTSSTRSAGRYVCKEKTSPTRKGAMAKLCSTLGNERTSPSVLNGESTKSGNNPSISIPATHV
jgi:hypothetical protein